VSQFRMEFYMEKMILLRYLKI